MSKIILAIDDDEVFLCTLKDIFEPEGFEFKTLSDPSKAEQYIDQYNPDLLIIDIFMPKRTGFNIVEDFKDKGLYKDVPKIFLTCLDDDIEKMTARACGVTHYITKPFSPDELVRRVKKILQ